MRKDGIMAVYIVSYDLNKAGQDYSKLYETLKSFTSWCHPVDSTWLLYVPSNSANTNAQSIYNRIRPCIDSNDLILVMRVTSDYFGWLKKDSIDWLAKYINL